jgi:hypothetical protein
MDVAISNSPVEETVWSDDAQDYVEYTRTPPALCLLCKDAGCEVGTNLPGFGSGSSYDCQREDAYSDT